ncbi:MAG: hypothetical protein AAFR23_05390, partial [Pseudomonadota bacterium]
LKVLELGARDLLVTARVAFDQGASASDVANVAQRVDMAIREQYAQVAKFYLEVSNPVHMGLDETG